MGADKSGWLVNCILLGFASRLAAVIVLQEELVILEGGTFVDDLSGPVSARLAHWVALQLAADAQSILAEQDSRAKLARLRDLCTDVTRLRRADLIAERLLIEREWLALEFSNTAHQRERDFWEWVQQPEVREKLFPDKEGGLSLETLQKIENELKLM
jgi:hypothetical protein